MKKTQGLLRIIFTLIVTFAITFVPYSGKNEKSENKNMIHSRLNKKIDKENRLLEKVDMPPVISSTTTTFFVACHIDFILDNFIKYISAYDEEDGNITNKVFIKENEYEQNKGKLGEFRIQLAVYDSSNNIATLDLKIKTVDILAPEIIGPKEIRTYKPLTDRQITSLYTAVDNVDDDVVSKIKVIKNTLIGSTPGNYKITLEVSDFSNNKLFLDIDYILLESESQVEDKIVGKIKTTRSRPLDNIDILNYLILIEEATLFDEISLTTNYYGNEHINGIYEVYVICKDALGAYRSFILLIEVNEEGVNNPNITSSNSDDLSDKVKYASAGALLVLGIILVKGKKRR